MWYQLGKWSKKYDFIHEKNDDLAHKMVIDGDLMAP